MQGSFAYEFSRLNTARDPSGPPERMRVCSDGKPAAAGSAADRVPPFARPPKVSARASAAAPGGPIAQFPRSSLCRERLRARPGANAVTDSSPVAASPAHRAVSEGLAATICHPESQPLPAAAAPACALAGRPGRVSLGPLAHFTNLLKVVCGRYF